VKSEAAPSADLEVIVRGMLLWKSEHVYGQRTLVRLHITDASPEESLEELAEVRQLVVLIHNLTVVLV
jgi:hypothetical protein